MILVPVLGALITLLGQTVAANHQTSALTELLTLVNVHNDDLVINAAACFFSVFAVEVMSVIYFSQIFTHISGFINLTWLH